MSKSRDSVDAIAEAIRDDEEAREALAEAVVDKMDVDDSMPEAQGAKAHRREVLKTLGLVGTGAAAGALGGTAATQEARAADTSVGQIGSSGSPVDVALDQLRDPGGDEVFDVDDSGDIVSQRGFEFPAVTTDDETAGTQNSNEVNLTKLVNEGVYSDILDAIANEPGTNAQGVRHVVEPGTYTVSTAQTVTYSNREVVAYGGGHRYNDAGDTAPVVIKWTGSTSTVPLTFGDTNTQTEGNTFRGLEFQPDTTDTAIAAFQFEGVSGAPTRDYLFDRVHIRDWGGPGIRLSPNGTANDNFAHTWRDCGIFKNSGQVDLQDQARVFGGFLKCNNGTTPGVLIRKSSSVFGTVINVEDGGTGPIVGDGAVMMPNKIETSSTGGSSQYGLVVQGGDVQLKPMIVTEITRFNTGIKFDNNNGANAKVMCSFNETGTYRFEFAGTDNDHNGTIVLGDIAPSNVNISGSTNQRMLLLPSGELTDAGYLPGLLAFDTDPAGDGSIAESLVYGPERDGGNGNYYFTNDGQQGR